MGLGLDEVVGFRFPFADWENKSSEPFLAVMSREQVLRLQNRGANFKLVRIGLRFPFADWENKSSEPFLAVMSREQVLRLQNRGANFKLLAS